MTLRPVLTIDTDPILIAELTAAVIRSDVRTGRGLALPRGLVYRPDRGINALFEPAETIKRGGGQCWDLVRLAGARHGSHVGATRTPIGVHVWLACFGGTGPGPSWIYDVAKLRGMPGEPDYTGAAYVPIWPIEGTGPTGYADPPPELAQTSEAIEAWADRVAEDGAKLLMGKRQADARRQIETEALALPDGTEREIRLALLASVIAIESGDGAYFVRTLNAKPLSVVGAKTAGALSALTGRPWRSFIGAGRAATQVTPSYSARPPILPPNPAAVTRFIKPPCPGSCPIR